MGYASSYSRNLYIIASRNSQDQVQTIEKMSHLHTYSLCYHTLLLRSRILLVRERMDLMRECILWPRFPPIRCDITYFWCVIAWVLCVIAHFGLDFHEFGAMSHTFSAWTHEFNALSHALTLNRPLSCRFGRRGVDLSGFPTHRNVKLFCYFVSRWTCWQSHFEEFP